MKPLKPLLSPLAVFFGLLLSANLHATLKNVSTPRATVPPNIITSSNRPMMMLATSKDHTLFGPIYTDFEDIDGDGALDTGFKPSFKYYGYFDATKCYNYSTASSRFDPAAKATITTDTVPGRFTCSDASNYWSGNFLNWASMTRLDVVRKMLYGGKRSTDTNGTTVLERAQLNFDAHSFAKFYAGTDIRDYTPFTMAALTKTTGSNANVYAGLTVCNLGSSDDTSASNTPIMRMAKGNYRLWATVEHRVCQFSDITVDVDSKFTAKLARYYKDSDKGGGGINHEIATPNSTTDGATYDSIGPNLTMRIKVCDPTQLGEERCQAFPPDSTTKYKPFGLLQEFGFSPSGGAARAEFGVITGSYDNNVTAGALRKNMGDFADEINPLTGIFCHSPSSGCVTTLTSPDNRTTGIGAIKAIDNFLLYGRASLNYPGTASQPPLTNGDLPAWGNPIGEMVVQALQYFAYDSTTPTATNPSSTTNDTAKGLPVQTWSNPLSNANTGRKSKYGNAACRPMYTLALSSSALSFDAQADSPFSTLPNRTLDTLANYTNAVGAAESLNGTLRSVGSVSGGFGDSCSGKTISNLNSVSGICPEAPAMGGSYQVAGAALYANTSKIRTLTAATTPALPGDLNKVKDALKVKTLAASLSGGAARVDVLIPGSNPKKYVYITPESLWNGNTGAILTFASISSSDTPTDKHGAFIVTWNDRLLGGDYDMDLTGFLRYDLIANASSPSGWDIKITTDIPANCSGASGTHGFSILGVTKPGESTSANGRYLTHQHFDKGIISSLTGKEGYLCGDSVYRNSTSANNTSHMTFNTTANKDGACYVNPIPVQTGSLGYCNVQNIDFPIGLTFNMVGAENALVKDPLWYAAKYGSFDSSIKQNNGTFTEVTLPTSVESWDKVKSDGSPGADGIPDGYFLARRPDLLEQQLRQALDDLAKNANAAPATSSSQLIVDGFKYIAKFDSTAVDGEIEAFKVDSLGFFGNSPAWLAGRDLTIRTGNPKTGDKGESRSIITNFGNQVGVDATSGGSKFRWSSLPATFTEQITTSASTNQLSEDNAKILINYMRGDQSKEASSTGLRQRGTNILGPIVNATPWIQDRPTANYTETNFPGYADFVSSNKTREKLLWVSSNDGMLHAFSSTTGAEVFAYVPGALANRLAEIPMQRGTTGRTRLDNANFTLDGSETLPEGTVFPYVDGSPFTGDVKTNSWKTYAFGSLGRGGKGIYALDVTNTSILQAAETGTNSKSIFKWQFTSEDDEDLGYLVNDISTSIDSGQASPIVKLNNGKFALLLGNGQKSSTGKAVLYMLFVDGPNTSGEWTDGVTYKKITVDSSTGNGLSTPTWVDLNNDGKADVVYAGDLKGNLWKFDISSESISDWDVAYKSGNVSKPLFTAKDGNTPLAITTAPEFAYPSFDGLIITFGTGNAFESTDFPNTPLTQKVFGIWDRPDFSKLSGRALPTGLSTLVPRTYSRQGNGNVTVTGTPGSIDWTVKDGWYFDLPGSSEMVLSDPDLRAGVLTLTTVRNNASVDNCSSTPNVTLYTIDPLSGKSERKTQGVSTISGQFVLNAGTEISDQKVRIINDRTKRSFTKQCRKGDLGCTCTTTAGIETCTKDSGTPECGAGQSALRVVGQSTDLPLCYSPNARVQWREIPGLRTDR
jgi:type IV pilus assembly protein PilY1